MARLAKHFWPVLGAALAAVAAAGDARAEAMLTGAEIEAALVAKAFRVKTRQVLLGDRDNPTGMTTRKDGGHAEIDIVVRADRSVIFKCMAYSRDGAGAPCRGGGYERDVGVWSVEGGHFCYQFLNSRGGRKQCYEVRRDGAAYRLRLASGPPSTVDGELMVPK